MNLTTSCIYLQFFYFQYKSSFSSNRECISTSCLNQAFLFCKKFDCTWKCKACCVLNDQETQIISINTFMLSHIIRINENISCQYFTQSTFNFLKKTIFFFSFLQWKQRNQNKIESSNIVGVFVWLCGLRRCLNLV